MKYARWSRAILKILTKFSAGYFEISCSSYPFKVRELDETANRLMQTHPDQAQSIFEHQKEINERWNDLTAKADDRKAKLLDSYDFQRFLSDFRDLMSWINSMKALVSSSELVEEIDGAQALLKQHEVKT